MNNDYEHIKCWSDNMLIQLLSDEDAKSQGGLYLPENRREKLIKGKVLVVGPGYITDRGVKLEMPFTPGDTVFFKKYEYIEADINNEQNLYVIYARDVKMFIKSLEEITK